MMDDERRARMHALSAEAIAAGSPTGWFEEYYQEAEGDPAAIPWMDLAPHPYLVEWLTTQLQAGPDARALVVGCGGGDDAAYLDAQGWRVTAFDIAPTAVAWAKQRFTGRDIAWTVADATNPPDAWRGRFDLIVEIYTLQTLPAPLRQHLLQRISACLAPGGTLIVICRGRDEDAPEGELPWKLTWNELDGPLTPALDRIGSDDLLDDETPPQRRFRAVYRRPLA
jgi:SAM-dependent methyltransferase